MSEEVKKKAEKGKCKMNKQYENHEDKIIDKPCMDNIKMNMHVNIQDNRQKQVKKKDSYTISQSQVV